MNQNSKVANKTFPIIKKHINNEIHYYTDDSVVRDDSLFELCSNILSAPGAESPLIVLPDVSKKKERISPTGIALSSHTHIIPSAVPAANGSGIRVLKLDLSYEDINEDILETFLRILSLNVPIYGYDSPKLLRPILRKEDLMNIYAYGAKWAQERLNIDEDSEKIESLGRLGEISHADNRLSHNFPEYFINQGLYGFGILESGNHFIELQYVEKIIDKELAQFIGIEEKQIVVMIHDGNPATLAGQYYHPVPFSNKKDSATFEKDKYSYHFEKNKTSNKSDRRCYFSPSTPYYSIEANSNEAERFMLLMNAACNYGFANRVALTRAVLDSIKHSFKIESINYELLTDTLHDCVKHTEINGSFTYVHRHGASEAQPASRFKTEHIFSKTGQVIGIPGSPGRHSLLCAAGIGTKNTFFTVNHGAGRKIDRGDARKRYNEEETYNEIRTSGASLLHTGLGKISGEIPFAYKNVEDVFEIAKNANLLNGIARLKPLAIYKG